MTEVIHCPKCQQKYPLKAELAGKKVRCVKCGATFSVPAAPASDLADFLNEELSAAASASAKAPPEDFELKRPEIPRRPAPREEAPVRNKRRRPKDAEPGKRKKLAMNLSTMGTVALVMTWGPQWMSGEPAITGPATATFALVMTIGGIVLIIAGIALSRSG